MLYHSLRTTSKAEKVGNKFEKVVTN